MATDLGDDSKIGSLRTVLGAAAVIVRELADDPQLARLLQIFAAMPTEDRDPILDVLEREVNFRRITMGSRDVIGWTARPNPNARLYARVFGPPDPQAIADLDVEHLTTAIHRLGQVVAMMRTPGMLEQWRQAARRGYGMLEAGERAANLQHARDLVAILCEGMTEPAND